MNILTIFVQQFSFLFVAMTSDQQTTRFAKVQDSKQLSLLEASCNNSHSYWNEGEACTRIFSFESRKSHGAHCALFSSHRGFMRCHCCIWQTLKQNTEPAGTGGSSEGLKSGERKKETASTQTQTPVVGRSSRFNHQDNPNASATLVSMHRLCEKMDNENENVSFFFLPIPQSYFEAHEILERLYDFVKHFFLWSCSWGNFFRFLVYLVFYSFIKRRDDTRMCRKVHSGSKNIENVSNSKNIKPWKLFVLCNAVIDEEL